MFFAEMFHFIRRHKIKISISAPDKRIVAGTTSRVGTKTERELWDETGKTFSRYGLVTPRISMKADMERFCTLSDLDGQLEITQEAYNLIYNKIFGHLEIETNNG